MSWNKENSNRKKSICRVRDCARNPLASIHRLPTKNQRLRKKWIDKLELLDIRDPFHVCGDHFISKDFLGGKARKRLRQTAVPSVNLPLNVASNSLVLESSVNDKVMFDMSGVDEQLWNSSSEHECGQQSDQLIINIDWSNEDELISEEENENFSANEATSFEYYGKTKNQATQTVKTQSCDKCIQANLAYDERLKPWSLLDALHTDSDLESWTGIPRFLTLNNIVKCVKRLSSAQAQLIKFKSTPELLTVIVMTKLKTNLDFKQLANLFPFKPKTLAKYFDKFVPVLKAVLQPAIFWPTKEQVFSNLPKSFKPDFDNCKAVMDCTEAPIEALKSLHSRIKTYSHYKGCHTAKINISTTSSGLVVHVSNVWGGKASDKFIVLQEKILEKFGSAEGIMVDKGFGIEKETFDKGIKLYRPPILDKPQHSKSEAIYNTKVATSRIHVERVIQRLKKFKIFRSKINKSMLKHIDNIVFIVCAITNLSPPVLSDDKF